MWNLLNVFEYLVLRKWWRFIFEFEVWEWCKNVWYWNDVIAYHLPSWVWEWCKNVWYWNPFCGGEDLSVFENDVKTYGTETAGVPEEKGRLFENDVKTYGTETWLLVNVLNKLFENDVKTYGTETHSVINNLIIGLRMM